MLVCHGALETIRSAYIIDLFLAHVVVNVSVNMINIAAGFVVLIVSHCGMSTRRGPLSVALAGSYECGVERGPVDARTCGEAIPGQGTPGPVVKTQRGSTCIVLLVSIRQVCSLPRQHIRDNTCDPEPPKTPSRILWTECRTARATRLGQLGSAASGQPKYSGLKAPKCRTSQRSPEGESTNSD